MDPLTFIILCFVGAWVYERRQRRSRSLDRLAKDDLYELDRDLQLVANQLDHEIAVRERELNLLIVPVPTKPRTPSLSED